MPNIPDAPRGVHIGPVTTLHRFGNDPRPLTPAMKLPGRTGAYLFHRADVEALAAARAGVGA